MKLNKKIALWFLTFASMHFSTIAQIPEFEWAKSFRGLSGDWSYDIAHDMDGNIYTTGYYNGVVDFDPGPAVYNMSGGGQSVFISKLDNQGNFVWAKSLTGHTQAGGKIVVDQEGSIYVTGIFIETMDFDPSDEDYFLTSTDGSADIYICKFDSLGSLIWAKQIGGSNYDIANSIVLDHTGNGDICISGHFNGTVDFDPSANVFNLTSNDSSDIFICKMDASGSFLWAKQFAGSDSKSGRQIKFDLDGSGSIYNIGSFYGTVDFNPDTIVDYNLTAINKDGYICKLSSSGDFIWAKQTGGISFEEGSSLFIDPTGTGEVVITGKFLGTVDFDPGGEVFNLTALGDYDIYIAKLTNSGDFVWAKSYGGNSSADVLNVALDIQGNIYTTGYFTFTGNFETNPSANFNLTSAGNYDVYINKLTSTGEFVWAKRTGGAEPDIGMALTIDNSGSLYITGVFYSSSIHLDGITLFNGSNFSAPNIFITKIPQTLLSLDNQTTNGEKLLYPNPSSDIIFVNLPTGQHNAIVTIKDVSGKILKSLIMNSNSIDISDLPNGIYVVSLKLGEKVISKKVIKK